MQFPLLTQQLSGQILATRWASVVTQNLLAAAEICREVLRPGIGWTRLLRYRRLVLRVANWADLSASTFEESQIALRH